MVEAARTRLDVFQEPVRDQDLSRRQIVAGDMVVPNDAAEGPP
jgi:hypothetical protein